MIKIPFLIENKEKRHPHDFALWKARKEECEPGWPSPWTSVPGRPGWHIECSTLATVAFGKHLDMHSGGKDLIFPHHQNEVTQCCAFHAVDQWSSVWIHTGHLHLSGQDKMSKSLGNTVSIRQLLKKYSSDQFRLFCLLNHYRYGTF
jgi:cysteinyl-tRNA synthetase